MMGSTNQESPPKKESEQHHVFPWVSLVDFPPFFTNHDWSTLLNPYFWGGYVRGGGWLTSHDDSGFPMVTPLQVTCVDLNGCSWMEVTGTPVTPWETVENDVAQRGGLEKTCGIPFKSTYQSVFS